jgi:hypothetical protein
MKKLRGVEVDPSYPNWSKPRSLAVTNETRCFPIAERMSGHGSAPRLRLVQKFLGIVGLLIYPSRGYTLLSEYMSLLNLTASGGKSSKAIDT